MDDRAAPRGEEVLEHVVGEEPPTVIGQEGLDAALGNELAAQGRRVEELSIGIAMCLHLPILYDAGSNREHHWVHFSTVS